MFTEGLHLIQEYDAIDLNYNTFSYKTKNKKKTERLAFARCYNPFASPNFISA